MCHRQHDSWTMKIKSEVVCGDLNNYNLLVCCCVLGKALSDIFTPTLPISDVVLQIFIMMRTVS